MIKECILSVNEIHLCSILLYMVDIKSSFHIFHIYSDWTFREPLKLEAC